MYDSNKNAHHTFLKTSVIRLPVLSNHHSKTQWYDIYYNLKPQKQQILTLGQMELGKNANTH